MNPADVERLTQDAMLLDAFVDHLAARGVLSPLDERAARVSVDEFLGLDPDALRRQMATLARAIAEVTRATPDAD